MTDLETRVHETWLGMVQPIEGLVVSVPVLVEAQCMARQTPEVQQKLIETEPKQIEALYQVVLHRLEPVGLVVLWPENRG